MVTLIVAFVVLADGSYVGCAVLAVVCLNLAFWRRGSVLLAVYLT
jgi:hypothetical protein